MRHVAVCIAGMLLAAGCTRTLPSTAPYPAPIPSAAQPGVEGPGDRSYAIRGAEALRKALRQLEPRVALDRIPTEGIDLAQERTAARCTAAAGPLPALLCQFGPTAEQPVAHALFWYALGGWQSQLYPQAPARYAAERKRALAELGCQIGCRATFRQARQSADGRDSTDLLVVIDIGADDGARAEEVHLLRLSGGEWQVIWVPSDGDWNYGDARVTLADRGIATFQVESTSRLKQDRYSGYLTLPPELERRYKERWVRKGNAFVLRDQVQEPGATSALVRLIHYLSTGANEQARSMLGDGVSLEQAYKALAQKPPGQGWKASPWGQNGLLLQQPANQGLTPVGVRFEPHDGKWLLVELRNVGPGR